jgi:hypothetical protein
MNHGGFGGGGIWRLAIFGLGFMKFFLKKGHNLGFGLHFI